MREDSVKDFGRVLRHTVSSCEPSVLLVSEYSAARCRSFLLLLGISVFPGVSIVRMASCAFEK